MAITLFDLTYKLARLLGTVTEGTATGGGITSIVDTVERSEDDDYWNGGTAWILYDAGGAAAAPEKEYSFISDHVSSTKTLTLRATLTQAVASGDGYAVATQRYPLQLLIQKINEVVGRIQKTDITSITTTADQLEYDLPTDLITLHQVWIATNLDANANYWQRSYDWDLQKTAGGTADKLIFSKQEPEGYPVKLVYLGYHPRFRVSTDQLDESYHENAVIYDAAVACLLWRKAKVGDSDTSVNELLNYYQNLAAKENQEVETVFPKKSSKTIDISLGHRKYYGRYYNDR